VLDREGDMGAADAAEPLRERAGRLDGRVHRLRETVEPAHRQRVEQCLPVDEVAPWGPVADAGPPGELAERQCVDAVGAQQRLGLLEQLRAEVAVVEGRGHSSIVLLGVD